MKSCILVVDDDKGVRSLIMTSLNRAGHRCQGAASAEEAYRLLEKDPFDLCLIDIALPDESGVQALMAIRSIRPQTDVIMVSANSNLETALFCMRQGAVDYVTKPFHIDQMRMVVERSLLRRKRLDAEAASSQEPAASETDQ